MEEAAQKDGAIGDSGSDSSLLRELLNALTSRPKTEVVDLPHFNPDKNDSSKWLLELEKLKSEFQWSDTYLLSIVGRYLLHSSHSWFELWAPDIRNWECFKRDFKEAFPLKRNLGKLLEDAASFNSLRTSTYETYVHEKLSLLRSLRTSWSESDLVELIIHGISEPDVRIACIHRNCSSIPDLLSFLSGFPNPFRPNKRENDSPGTSYDSSLKRRRQLSIDDRSAPLLSNKQCHLCFRFGHIRNQCPLAGERRRFDPVAFPTPSSSLSHVENPQTPRKVPLPGIPTFAERNRASSASFDTPAKSEIIKCQFCFKQGHDIDSCFMRASIEKRKNIRLISTHLPSNSTPIKIDGHSFACLIDSGADISLISEKYLPLFQHKVQACDFALRGIVPGHLKSSWTCSAKVEITGVTFETNFYFVSDSCLDYDVFIGRNIYEDPLVMTITDHSGSRIVRKPQVSINRVADSDEPKILELCVPDEYFSAVSDILRQFPLMITTGNRVRPVINTSMSIKLEKDIVVNRHPYRLSAHERCAVRDIISDLLTNNIIRESDSPYASPITLVKKKDNSYRMCVDFRELNRLTIKDRYPLPLIEDQLDRLGNNQYFTSLDMASGFHQIPIAEDSILKSAFVTPDGHYEYLRMPFGLANAPAVFQHAVNKALGPLRHSVAVVYLDDILIPSKTVEEGLLNLTKVLQALDSAGFSLNMKKCKFLQTSVEYLGREVSVNGIRPGKKKVEALQNSPVPANPKQVRQFMGLANYFRKFVPEFASRTACITELTKAGKPFLWGPQQDAARDYVISCLTNRPLLAIFDPTLSTELHTDASSLGYGAILLQYHGPNQPRVVAYYSQHTSKDEENYHSYELETLAVVNAFRHFRVYLLGIKFKLVTDCNAIKATATKKDILPRVARWWMYMQDFDFEILYRKGSNLAHVDYLSRNPISQEIGTICRITCDSWLHVQQKGSAEVQEMLKSLREGNLDATQYEEKNGILYYKMWENGSYSLRWFVPRQSRLGLLRLFHDEQCHVGADKTLLSIRAHFWFPGMRHFVNKYVKNCLVCAVHKTRTGPLQGYVLPVEKPDHPFHTLHADCLGPLPATSDGFKYLLVVVDSFSKYCILEPLRSVTIIETEKTFLKIIGLFGTPKLLVTDPGSNFKNTSFPRLLESLKIEHHLVTTDLHRGNGQVERYMRTVMNMLRVETQVKSEWSSGIWKVQLVLNSTIQKSTGLTPLQLLIGVNSSTPLIQAVIKDLGTDVTPVRNRQLDRERVARKLNDGSGPSDMNSKRRNSVEFSPGDFVLVHRDSTMHNSKFNYTYLGPYEVITCLPRGRYELKKVGSSVRTKAAKEQLRLWPSDWYLCSEIMELMEAIDDLDALPTIDLCSGSELSDTEDSVQSSTDLLQRSLSPVSE
ncbi:Hypothetical Protein NTJ_07326 [Nesidiocoris tenuis]|uniref:RNA-directed DNA polymerase n=1 Tax=Nesidiocoris tenuis TaxID=355587 RepID=A0ABN7AT99_9HEMI|nr:Hypothetical Protein NTJ_07326 [Nesidiocoris tenuis]